MATACPDFKTYPYDTFLQGKGRPGWHAIGRTDFKLFSGNQDAMQKEIED